MKLATLRAALRKANSPWTAENGSRAAVKVGKAGFGLRVDKQQLAFSRSRIRQANMRAVPVQSESKEKCDWRNQAGMNWVTEVKDQQHCGACVAFALCAVVEARIRILKNDPEMEIDLSENHLFFCGCENCCESGWYFDEAIEFARAEGLVYCHQSPYTPENKSCPKSNDSAIKIMQSRLHWSMEDRKHAISTRGPVMAGMTCFQDFLYYKSGVYKYVQGEEDSAYHAVAVVGFDDFERCWLVKNSWGKKWGDDGFVKIAYGDKCGIDTEFPFYEVDAHIAAESAATCALYRPILREVLAASEKNKGLRDALLFYLAGLGHQPVLTGVRETLIRNVLLIMRDCPQFMPAFTDKLIRS